MIQKMVAGWISLNNTEQPVSGCHKPETGCFVLRWFFGNCIDEDESIKFLREVNPVCTFFQAIP